MRAFELAVRPPRRRTCAVRVGRGALGDLVDHLAARPPGRPLVIVSDTHVAPLHAEPLGRRLRRRGLAVELVVVPAGERSKSRSAKARVEDALAAVGAGRDSAILAVGGGVVGDLAGFVAATWQRGVPIVHVPTTLLSMVDSALGGKTAIDVPAGKNLVGAFHQPLSVWADVDTLVTLPSRDYADGFAEIVKTATVADARLFGRLERTTRELLDRDPVTLEATIHACLRIKGRLVVRDERDAGPRAALNFGHTVAHALESAGGRRIRHGRAVAVGLAVEARLAARATGFPAADRRRLEALLGELGLATRPPAALDVDAVVAATRLDKKNRRGRVRYALPARLGSMPPGPATVAIGERALRAALRRRTN